MTRTYLISALFDEDGYAVLIMMLDRKMAMHFK
jgi:hypothetical protein